MNLPQREASACRPAGRSHLRLERLEARETPAAVGTLDPSYGVVGITTTVANAASITQTAVDSQGRLVMVGTTTGSGNHDVVVFRFNTAGIPDPFFVVGGRQTIDFGGDDTGVGVAVDAQDNVIVSAETTGGPQHGVAFARLSGATGQLDTTFGTGGTGKLVVADPDGTAALGGPLALDAAGRPVAARTVASSGAGGSRLEVLRLTANGSGLDPAFNGGAPQFLTAGVSSVANATGLTIDAAGRIVAAGTTPAVLAGSFGAVVGRLLPDGTPDPAFHGGTLQVFIPDGALSATTGGVDTDPAGNVYLAGTSATGTTQMVMVAKITDAGVFDTAFGTNGVAAINPPGSAAYTGVDVAVTPSGRVVVGGTTSQTAPNTNFLVARLLPNGTLDPAFNAAGTTPGLNVFNDGTTAVNQGGSLALLPNGRIYVGGSRPGANVATNTIEAFRLIGTVERPRDLAVGAVNQVANVYAPSGGTYANPPARTTPGGLEVPPFAGDVRTATGDVNGDGFEDTVELTGPGTLGRMAVVSGKDNSVLLAPSDPYGDAGGFFSGGFVTAGDLDGDGRAEWVVTPNLNGGPRVIIFGLNPDGSLRLFANFFGIQDPSFRDGARAALGDVNGDGTPDVLVIAAFNGGPRTAVFDGKDVPVAAGAGRDPLKLVGDFFAAPSGADEGRGGRGIAAGDVNGDGFADYIVTGDSLLGQPDHVTVYSGADLAAGKFPGLGATVLADFGATGLFNTGAVVVPEGGINVATVDADGDNKADLVVGAPALQKTLVKIYLGKDLSGTAEPASTVLDAFGTTAPNGVFVG